MLFESSFYVVFLVNYRTKPPGVNSFKIFKSMEYIFLNMVYNLICSSCSSNIQYKDSHNLQNILQ